MEKLYVYKNINKNIVVPDFMAEEYVLDELGLKIIPKGEHGGTTIEQKEFIEETIEWFFSGNWIKEEVCDV